jgi:hypothetical protein
LWPDPCETLISEGKFLNSLWLLAARLVGVEDAQKSAGMKQTAVDYLRNTSANEAAGGEPECIAYV